MSDIRIFKYRDVLPQLFSIIVHRRLKFHFERIPYQANRLPVKKILNFFLAGSNQFFLPPGPAGYPVFAQIEPANFCNLSCPLCLTTSETGSRPKAALSLAHFRKMIDEVGDYLLLIILWNWGEPFLNPDIFQMIAYAKSKGILVHCSTNGNVTFDETKVDSLINSGLDTLIFGVDGVTQEIYCKYRRGGDIEKVWQNIRTIVRAKKERGSVTPRLNLRLVVMRHNEHEMPLIKERAKDLGVDFLSFKNVDLPPAREEADDQRYAPKNERYRRYAYKKGSYQRIEKPFVCMRPWKRIAMDASGEIIPCEFDYKNRHSFGNIQDDSILSTWRGKRAVAFRRDFNLGRNGYYFCKDCTYKNRLSEDCTVEMIDLRSGHNPRGGNRL